MKSEIGGDVILLESEQPDSLAQRIAQRFGLQPTVLDHRVRLEIEAGHRFVTDVVEAFPGEIEGVSVHKPSLEDVFIRRTGHRFWTEEERRQRQRRREIAVARRIICSSSLSRMFREFSSALFSPILVFKLSLPLVQFRQMRPRIGGIGRKLDRLFLEGSGLFQVAESSPSSRATLRHIESQAAFSGRPATASAGALWTALSRACKVSLGCWICK